MQNVILQKLVLPREERLLTQWTIFYRCYRLMIDEWGMHIPAKTTVDFSTYMNGFPYNKWKLYTGLSDLSLTLRLKGKCKVNLTGYTRTPLHAVRNLYFSHTYDFDEVTEIRLPFENVKDDFLAFELESETDMVLESGYFSSNFEERRIRDVNLAVATTTFRKEEYITHNVELIRKELLESDDEIREHLYLNVVDNGKTLKREDIESYHIRLFYNDNVGGSGGFSRGMYESIHMEGDITHVLLMDDDVLIITESLRRTYALLKVVNDTYKDAFISGAMLEIDSIFFMCEDVGMIKENRDFQHVKPQLDIRKLDCILQNNVEVPYHRRMFAGWWYCCIPAQTIREKGYAMPLFIRGDDMEYGIRCKPKFMTMSGISIWHMYAGKYSAALYYYMEFRNMFIVKDATGNIDDVDVLGSWKRECLLSTLNLDYGGWELLLLAMEDYLKGPSFIGKDHGTEILQRNKKFSENMKPLSELGDESFYVEGLWAGETPPPRMKRYLYYLTLNGQRWIPETMLTDELATIRYDRDHRPGRSAFHKRILVFNHFNQTYNIRTMDKKKFRELKKRQNALLKEYSTKHEKVKKAYRKAYPELISEKFWIHYLKLDTKALENN